MSTLKPENFDNAIEAKKIMSKYDSEKRTFGAASLALNFGTILKKLADLATKSILRRKIRLNSDNFKKTLLDIKRFKKLVEVQWTTEVGSLALKDLHEKASIKPKLLPITQDIMKLKSNTENTTEKAFEELTKSKSQTAYRTLVESTLVLTILDNRKRVGDIQYLDIKSFEDQTKNMQNTCVQTELATSLTENERVLTPNYQRIVSIGKGSRSVTVLHVYGPN